VSGDQGADQVLRPPDIRIAIRRSLEGQVLDAVDLYNRRHLGQEVGMRLISPFDPHISAGIVEFNRVRILYCMPLPAQDAVFTARKPRWKFDLP
jgi:hypothetical protein